MPGNPSAAGGASACWATSKVRHAHDPEKWEPVFGQDHAQFKMKSAWVERDAKEAVDRYGKAGVAADLALRIYSTRLLGRNPRLVLHGGGNSSLKTKARDLAGEEVAVLRVKGSGADMGAIEPAGFPAVRLEPLRALRARKKLSDDEMARVQRAYLIDPQAPSPSVEMLLHAFMPAKYIDHTHATAVLSLIDQPKAAALCAQVFSGRLGFVPYIMPGFGLAKKATEVFDKNPKVEGLILDKHGIFTFGANAREAYERMIAFVTRAENRLKKNRKAVFAGAKLPQRIAPALEVAPILRGACTLRDAGGEGAHRRPILEFRVSDAILNFVNGKDVARYACAGVVTPDHVIRSKPWPLIVPAPQVGKLDAFKSAALKAAQKFIEDYKTYFARHQARARGPVMHDPLPRVALVPGLGLFGMGASAKDATIAADIAQAAVEGITDAEAIGRFTSISQADIFDCEYWPLELAKLGARKDLPLAGQVAVITGAGGAWQGRIGEVDEAVLRESFELNFFAHQKVAQAAVKIMLAQGTGGCLLFNVSKQAVNPGANFGPYGLPKAATLFLVRQYALDYGADGIRANAVNDDRIRSGLLTSDFIRQRAKARGVSENDYMTGNLLGREVTAQDVAQAFLAQALALKTTADVTTVDGGNIAAALR